MSEKAKLIHRATDRTGRWARTIETVQGHVLGAVAINGFENYDEEILLADLFASAPDTLVERDRLREVNAGLLAFAEEMLFRYPNSPWIAEAAGVAIAKAKGGDHA